MYFERKEKYVHILVQTEIINITFSVLGVLSQEKFVSDFIKADLIHIFSHSIDLSIYLQSKQHVLIILTWTSFFHTKETDIQRVRERLKHEDKFGRVIKIKFNKKFQKLHISLCLCSRMILEAFKCPHNQTFSIKMFSLSEITGNLVNTFNFCISLQNLKK